MDFSESMVPVPLVQSEPFTTQPPEIAKTCAVPMKLSSTDNVFADKISTESIQSAPNAPPDQVIIAQLGPASLAVKMKSHQILSVFAGQTFPE